MYAIKISFKSVNRIDGEIAYNAVDRYLSVCRMNGQILGREQPIVFLKNIYYAYVLTPEKDSLRNKYSNKWVEKSLGNLNDIGIGPPHITIIGRDPGSMPVGKMSDSNWCILFTDYLTLESPIRSGEGFKPIPLYSFPKTIEDEYNDIICWQSDYQSCDNLQMNCSTGERFGIREMSDLHSSLTNRGLEICKKLNKLTHIPFYYYLHHANGRSASSELSRTCPSCGSKRWRLTTPLYDWIDFKCDKCRLLSIIPSQFMTREK